MPHFLKSRLHINNESISYVEKDLKEKMLAPSVPVTGSTPMIASCPIPGVPFKALENEKERKYSDPTKTLAKKKKKKLQLCRSVS